MSGETFKFPPGMRSAEEWGLPETFCQADIVAIQRDAVEAARREVEAEKPGYGYLRTADKRLALEQLKAYDFCQCTGPVDYTWTHQSRTRVCVECSKPLRGQV